ncbi:MAG: thioredoxin family protein [Candidatus Bathyarchaeia archaeon]
MGTPTLVFFCAGRPVEEIVGFILKEDLKEKLEEILKKYKECIKKSTELRIYL